MKAVGKKNSGKNVFDGLWFGEKSGAHTSMHTEMFGTAHVDVDSIDVIHTVASVGERRSLYIR